MTGHHDHPVPLLGCTEGVCATWSARMLADDDRSLEELVEVIERATTTLALRQRADTLAEPTEADAKRIARLLLTTRALTATSTALFRRHATRTARVLGIVYIQPTTTEETDHG